MKLCVCVCAVSNGSEIVRADQEYIKDEHVMKEINSSGIRSDPEATGGSDAGNPCLLPVKVDLKLL